MVEEAGLPQSNSTLLKSESLKESEWQSHAKHYTGHGGGFFEKTGNFGTFSLTAHR